MQNLFLHELDLFLRSWNVATRFLMLLASEASPYCGVGWNTLYYRAFPYLVSAGDYTQRLYRLDLENSCAWTKHKHGYARFGNGCKWRRNWIQIQRLRKENATCVVNSCQENAAGVLFWQNYSIHQHALALEVIELFCLDVVPILVQ